MNNYNEKEVINGTFGEAWIGDEYIEALIGVKANIKRDFEDIKKPRQLMKFKKEVGREGSGEVKLYHIDSFVFDKLYKQIADGHQESMTFMSKLNDPDSSGEERFVLRNVVFEEIPIADYEAAKAGEKTLKFFFSEFEPINTIERR